MDFFNLISLNSMRFAIFLLKLASPHCGKICASSGQWFWKNIFHTYHTSAFVKLFSCVSKHVTHLGSWFGKQFLTKLTIFLLKMSSPHCGYIRASSGQWFRNIFSTYITLLRFKAFLLCELTWDSSWMLV